MTPIRRTKRWSSTPPKGLIAQPEGGDPEDVSGETLILMAGRAVNFLNNAKSHVRKAIRRGIRSVLQSRTAWTICGHATDGLEAVEKARVPGPDVMQPPANHGRAGQPARDNAGSVAPRGCDQSQQSGRAANRSRSPEPPVDLLAAIVDSSDDAIISKSLDGVITSWNESAARIFGYTAAEAIGQNITLIVPPERRSEEAQILERLRRGERISRLQTVRTSKAGTRLSVSLTISPVRNSAGRVIGASTVARDVTEQQRAEERERQLLAHSVAATAKFRAVFEQTSVFAGILNNDGITLEVNKLSLEGCGYRAEQVLGREFWDTPWWREFPESRAKIRAATPRAAQGLPFREILNYSCADGTRRIVEFALYPIVDDDGRVCFLHPTGVDITVLKSTEESYRRLSKTLDAQVQARTREVEARTADVLRQAAQLRELSWRLLRTQDEERRYVARELHDSAGQTLAVMGMDLAQLVDKAGRLAPELLPEVEVVQQSLQQLQKEIRTTSYLLHPPLLDDIGLAPALSWYVGGLAERTSLGIRLDIAEDFGRLPRELELAVFRTVQEGLTNIHRHSGSKTALISITRSAGRVTVAVEDCGRGMSKEKLVRLQSGGFGIGIAGMHERLRQFDGTLSIKSGKAGTRIRATIPVPVRCSGDADLANPVGPLRAAAGK